MTPSTVASAIAITLLSISATTTTAFSTPRPTTSPQHLQMVAIDPTVIQGAGVAVAGLAAGFGLVTFTEQQGERSKARGGGLSDETYTRISGKLMEDVEMSSVSDLGGLTSQLENALKENSSELADEFELSEEDKAKIAADLDDGW